MMIDKYLYPNSDVLKNNFDITDLEQLKKKEMELFLEKYDEIKKSKWTFSYDVQGITSLHHFLFSEIFSFAGSIRDINIEKYEKILKGLSVSYDNCENIVSDLEKVLQQYKITEPMLQRKNLIAHTITDLIKEIWKIHPFREGNTRTTITFMICYLNSLGIGVKDELFREHSAYVRDSLVAAIFEDKGIGVYANDRYLYQIVLDSLK